MRINLESLPLKYPPAIEWLRANNLDTKRVPVAQEVLIEDGKITLDLFVVDENGMKKLTPDQAHVVTERITVPCISSPAAHNLFA